MKFFKKNKKDDKPSVNKTIFDTTFISDLVGVTAVGYGVLKQYDTFQNEYENIVKDQLSNSKVDFLNEDMMDPTNDSFARLQKSDNYSQKINHDYTNQCIANQVNKYKAMNAIYDSFINDVAGGLKDEK